ncbi:MAG TPA: hypothetical protein VFN77_11355, partial [Acetobacteraceae bacterium]|nr:hypothetical protein [Acetobacteraceae bacterium]
MTMLVKALLLAAGAICLSAQGMVAHADQYPHDLKARPAVNQTMLSGGGESYPVFAYATYGKVAGAKIAAMAPAPASARQVPFTSVPDDGG